MDNNKSWSELLFNDLTEIDNAFDDSETILVRWLTAIFDGKESELQEEAMAVAAGHGLPVLPEHDFDIDFYQILGDESDRGLLLVSAGRLDQRLEKILREHFQRNVMLNAKDFQALLGPKNPRAILGTFHSRTLLAFALGLISKETRNTIDAIRSLRNDASHSDKKFRVTRNDVCKVMRNLPLDTRCTILVLTQILDLPTLQDNLNAKEMVEKAHEYWNSDELIRPLFGMTVAWLLRDC